MKKTGFLFRSKLTAIILLLMFGWLNVDAQDNEYGVWTSFTLSKKLKKWDLSSTAEFRTTEFLSDINRFSLDIDGGYNVFKKLKLGAEAKFIYFNDFKYDDYQPRGRYAVYGQGKWKLDRFNFSLREKIECTVKDVSDRIKSSGAIDTYKINPEWYWRNKLKIQYDIRSIPVTPSVSVESFYQLNNPSGNMFDEIRYTLSLQYRLSKKQSVEVFGLKAPELNVTNPATKYVVGVNYTISL
ncbi:MAG: hypothetical protein RIS29_347 [Bacteroidota bacterium]|jgi:hypothetical protein